MNETGLVTKIRAAITAKYPKTSFTWKEHGGMYGTAGIPDIVGHVDGRFISIEVKMPGNVPTDLQARTMEKINQSGGISFWADDVTQAMSDLERRLKS